MLILILAQKVVLGTISDNMTKNHYFMSLFGLTTLTNSVAVATPNVTGDHKLFKRMCYMLKLKAPKFQLPTPDGF